MAASDWVKWDVEKRAQSIVDEALRDVSQRYKMQEELGAGAQATVYKATHRKNYGKVAIKVIELKDLEDDELFDALRLEVGMLRQLSHPNVVGLKEVIRDASHVYIVQECLGGGELFDRLLAKGAFKEDYALTIFAQVACAVEYMHSCGVVHRDLKAENLVFCAKGSPAIKFIDFGGACSWTQEQGLVGLVGTPQYVAPEVVTGFGDFNPTHEPYGKQCDLWSMGVLLYVMLSKTMPFRAKQVDQLLKQVLKGKFSFAPDERWRAVSAEARDLISRLLCVDPAQRLTIAQVRSHPWCADAIGRYELSLPKPRPPAPATKPAKPSVVATAYLFPRRALRKKSPYTSPAMRSGAGGADAEAGVEGESSTDRRKGWYVSKEQQYWYALEISPPTHMQQVGGVKVGADGTFEMANVPMEMRKVLEEIARQKAGSDRPSGEAAPTAASGSAGSSSGSVASNGSGGSACCATHSPTTTIGLRANLVMGVHIPASAPPPPPGPPPVGPAGQGAHGGRAGDPRDAAGRDSRTRLDSAVGVLGAAPGAPAARGDGRGGDGSQRAEAEMTRLSTETAAYYLHGGGAQNEAMETLALVREKEDQIALLQNQTAAQAAQLDSLHEELRAAREAADPRAKLAHAKPPRRTAPASADVPPPLGAAVPAAVHAELAEALRAALDRAERAEAEVEGHKIAQAKLQAKLAAVTTLYTESMTRSAALQASMSWTSEHSATS